MTRVGIVAALPGELKPLVKGWRRVAAGKHMHRWEKAGRGARWIAVCAGIGRDAATRAFAEAERDGALSAVVSMGWVGAVTAEIQPGQVYPVAQVLDARTGEQFPLVSSERKLRLVTTARVADRKEKLRLAEAYPGAVLVDMEGATVARLASLRSIPMYCFKGVSDGLADRIPDLNPFIDGMGQFHTARFALSAIYRPRYWNALRRFGENSRKAAQALAVSVGEFLENEEYLRDSR